MPDSSSPSDDVFDLDRIRRLVELMKEHDLSEVDLRQARTRIRVRRGAEVVVQSHGQPMSLPAAQSVPGAAASLPEATAAAQEKLLEIKSPMVGTFYAASGPDAPPFVKVGDRVSPETTVCLIEAMKVFNEIPAEVSGTVAAARVENGDAVEYGQVLFLVRPDA
jgi:acetyl-CoA carboxylase biotin carboxyl carrier protein